MRITALIVALLLATSAHAQAASSTATTALTWTPATQYVDNTPMTLAGQVVFWGAQSRFSSGTMLRAGCTAKPASLSDTGCYANAVAATVGGSFTVTTTITQSTTLYFAVVSNATNGQWGAYSNEASKGFTVTTTGVDPKPPITITITVTLGTCTTNVPGQTCTVTSP